MAGNSGREMNEQRVREKDECARVRGMTGLGWRFTTRSPSRFRQFSFDRYLLCYWFALNDTNTISTTGFTVI